MLSHLRHVKSDLFSASGVVTIIQSSNFNVAPCKYDCCLDSFSGNICVFAATLELRIELELLSIMS